MEPRPLARIGRFLANAAARIGRAEDALVPAEADRETRRRLRVILALAAVLNVAILACLPLDATHGAPGAALAEAIGLVAVDLLLLHAVPRGRVALAGHVFAGVMVLNLVLMAAQKGGLVATEVAWQCAAIVCAVLVLGPRGAFPWVMVACLGLGFQAVRFDATPWAGQRVALASPAGYVADVAVLYLTVWGVAYAFDHARHAYLHRLETRNDEMARVLEHARDALVTIDRAGRLGRERSRRAVDLLGPTADGETLWEALAREPANALAAEWFAMGWETLLEDILPREAAFEQMPRRLVLGGRTLSVEVIVIDQAGAVAGALVVLHDITEQLAHERAERRRRELLGVFEQLRTDSAAVAELVAELDRLVAAVAAGTDRQSVLRDIHTIKGSSALFGVESLAELCHDIEERCAESGGLPTADDRAALSGQWEVLSNELRAWASAVLGEHHVSLAREEVDDLRQAVRAGVSHAELAARIARWELVPLSRVLARLARQGTLLARKLGKEVDFVVRPSALRVDGERYAPVFSSMTHVIRNALDHGIEDADERLATGKPARGGIVLSAASRAERGEIVVAVADDGPGIDWERVRAKAAAAGLPAATEEDLVDALLSDGFSTREEATELSGRGVGLSAVRAAAEALGGAVRVRSVPHHGSTVEILLPDDAETAPVRAKPAA